MGDRATYKKWVWLLHLAFWLMVSLLTLFILGIVIEEKKILFTALAVNLIGYLILIYVHLFYLLPRFFDQKKYKTYTWTLLILLLATSAFRFFVGWGTVRYMGWELENAFTPNYFISILVAGAFFLLVSIPLKLVDNWIKKEELEQALKTHQLEAELRFLKAQVNPHFLFNALNNIYALSFTESKKAPEMILKLSDMMSYMLYDCNSEKVPLHAEIAYLHNYIDLQQLKKDGEFQIDFQVKGEVDVLLVPPMLFIPFFENAFKHGNLEDTQNAYLNSCLQVRAGRLDFKIKNTFNPHYISTKRGGLGLENIQKRLELLFPGKHSFETKKQEGLFSVNLTLNTSQA